MRKYAIGGNWKLQINTKEKTKEVLTAIHDQVASLNLDQVIVFLALPYTTLAIGQEILQDSAISLAAQNVHYEEKGPYTGEISIESLKELGVEYILVGHSERRIIFGETDSIINKKLKKILDHNLKAVVCIGETAAQRNSGQYKEILSAQLKDSLAGITEKQLSSIIIAYEPVWAINNKLLNPDSEINAATPEEAKNTHEFIRSWIASTYSQTVADEISIQYGGSMKPNNCSELLALADIDGGLIGGASLSADTFLPIINTAISMVV